ADDAVRLAVGEPRLDPRDDRFGGLHGHVAEVETAHQDLLVRELSQHGTIELGLRGLDRDLTTRARRELRQERVSGRALVNEGRIAEAEMNRRRTSDALQRSIQRLQAVLSEVGSSASKAERGG